MIIIQLYVPLVVPIAIEVQGTPDHFRNISQIKLGMLPALVLEACALNQGEREAEAELSPTSGKFRIYIGA